MSRRRRVPGGDICTAEQVVAADGTSVFVKSLDGAPAGFFAAEARGLAWLAGADGGPPLPAVLDVTPTSLTLEWVEQAAPGAAAAQGFGRALARLHAAGADSFGGGLPPGFAGSLPQTNEAAAGWPGFFAGQRLLPLVRRGRDAGRLTADQAAAVERLCARLDRLGVPDEPPARLHGDLWSGNLLWGADGRVWLVDAAAAHAGHRETDLAMLHLFGAPQLDVVLAAYQEVAPLADGWRERLPLHQLHPLLVHAVLFGGGWGAAVARAAQRYA